MSRKCANQTSLRGSLRLQHQESTVQRVTLQVREKLQGGRVIVPSIGQTIASSQLVTPVNFGTLVDINVV